MDKKACKEAEDFSEIMEDYCDALEKVYEEEMEDVKKQASKLLSEVGNLLDDVGDDLGDLGFTDKAKALMASKDNIMKAKKKIPWKMERANNKL